MPSMPRPNKELTKIAYRLIGMPVNHSDSDRKGPRDGKQASSDNVQDKMWAKIVQNGRQSHKTY